jgi:hypothetical protein
LIYSLKLKIEKIGEYSFDSSGNVLNINKGSLLFNSNINMYQFRVETIYLNETYSQIFSIQVDPFSSVLPVANLK